MNVSEFVSKWQKVELTERSASQQHFLDLCEVFDHPKPAADDPSGERFTFEKGAAKHGGGQGWADVWKQGFFGWGLAPKGDNEAEQLVEAHAHKSLQRTTNLAGPRTSQTGRIGLRLIWLGFVHLR